MNISSESFYLERKIKSFSYLDAEVISLRKVNIFRLSNELRGKTGEGSGNEFYHVHDRNVGDVISSAGELKPLHRANTSRR